MELIALAAELVIDEVLLDNSFKNIEIIEIIKNFLFNIKKLK